MIKKSRYKKYLKKDKKGKYYLVDTNGEVLENFNGIDRETMYLGLVNSGLISEDKSHIAGMENFIVYINRVLDGSLYVKRLKVYRVSDKTKSLKEQIRDEAFKFIKEGYR